MFNNMSTSPSKIGLPYNYAEYLCDTVDDIKLLPINVPKKMNDITCSIGSKALVISTKDLYILNNSSEWVLLKNVATSGSSGSGTIITNDIASVEEITSYLGI